ncbi:hypothetical protein MLD38_003888 [Melastoma candidum]|uniref:Uncharacterized protein n=1 Tax=Melastoma candidum TaxID=119954 RepID=A0ACB9S404_9MYRT|nr:hypothetical protein MLD38_003888 [Melastoma candidum]
MLWTFSSATFTDEKVRRSSCPISLTRVCSILFALLCFALLALFLLFQKVCLTTENWALYWADILRTRYRTEAQKPTTYLHKSPPTSDLITSSVDVDRFF